jgi:hypothetical protein
MIIHLPTIDTDSMTDISFTIDEYCYNHDQITDLLSERNSIIEERNNLQIGYNQLAGYYSQLQTAYTTVYEQMNNVDQGGKMGDCHEQIVTLRAQMDELKVC